MVPVKRTELITCQLKQVNTEINADSVQTTRLTQEGRLEEGLGAAETLVTDGDDLTIGKLIALLQGGGGGSSGHLVLEVQSHIAQLLLDVTHNLTLSCDRALYELARCADYAKTTLFQISFEGRNLS